MTIIYPHLCEIITLFKYWQGYVVYIYIYIEKLIFFNFHNQIILILYIRIGMEISHLKKK